MGELIGSVSAGLLFGISIRFFVTLFSVIYSFLSVFFFESSLFVWRRHASYRSVGFSSPLHGENKPRESFSNHDVIRGP